MSRRKQTPKLSYADALDKTPLVIVAIEDRAKRLRAAADAAFAAYQERFGEYMARVRAGADCSTCSFGPTSRGWRAPCCACKTPGYSLWRPK